MHVVILSNESGSGFSIEALQALRGMEGITRVDGEGLTGEGRFRRVLVYFPSAELAELFIRLAAEHFGDEVAVCAE